MPTTRAPQSEEARQQISVVTGGGVLRIPADRGVAALLLLQFRSTYLLRGRQSAESEQKDYSPRVIGTVPSLSPPSLL